MKANTKEAKVQNFRQVKSAERPGHNVPVREVMNRDFAVISPDRTLSDAADVMRNSAIPILPVSRDGSIEGRVTPFLIMERGLLCQKDPDTTPVSEVMDRKLACVREHHDVWTAVDIMRECGMGGLIVIDGQNRPVGILDVRAVQQRIPETVRTPTFNRGSSNSLCGPHIEG